MVVTRASSHGAKRMRPGKMPYLQMKKLPALAG